MANIHFKILNKGVGKAIHEYDMIREGDRIAIGISGGKDSLSLMCVLKERLSWIPIKYELFGIYIDLGFKDGFASELKNFCETQGISLRIEYTDYGIVAHSEKNTENPCFLCSRLRRKRLFEIAHDLGCKKLALAHHMDDIIETLFLNMFYAGQISTMKPYQPFFKGKIIVIRPFAFVGEDRIRDFAKFNNFPNFINPCPTVHKSKRHKIKDFLKDFYKDNNKVKSNIFRAMKNINSEYML
ncbi:MAG: tRNA 2-thiocytidine(32) synthetase TtcA [Desulfobacterales bacterium]|nr:tRNA 2-thiocytidine(32) synthetase TtcA [Desulfobacterales bacterium]